MLLILSGLLSLAIVANNSQGFGGGELTIWGIVGVANWLGVVGLALGRKQAQLGGVLVVLGGLAFAAFYFWASLPLAIGPAIAVVGVLRARRLAAEAPGLVPA